MNVNELYELASWYQVHFEYLSERYNKVHNILAHNSQQPNQQSLETPLDELLSYLSEMNMGVLSIQQLSILEKLGVGNLVGTEGEIYISELIKTVTYDPASTNAKFNKLVQRINEVNSHFTSYLDSINAMDLSPDTFEPAEGQFVVRVGFKNDASINNVVDWKKSSDEWHHIIRGLAIATNETVEDVKVIGATKGSLILVLAATAPIVILFATISKHIASIAKDVLSVRIMGEKLRQEQMMTKKMQAEFDAMEKQKREDGLTRIQDELAEMLPDNINGEVQAAFDKSIEKLLNFAEKGGDLDFVAPPEDDADKEGALNADDDVNAKITEARTKIIEYQEEREIVKRLENKS